MKKMLAAVLYGPRDVRLESVEVPEPGPGEVLIEVKSALTCGTDAKVYLRGGHPKMIKTPAVFGHEFAGVVARAGDGVEGYSEGTAVVAVNSAPCLRCFYCRLGRHSMCEDLLFMNGAFAQFALVPARIVQQNMYAIPEGLSFRDAALLEPLACVFHGVERSEMRMGDTVVVNGVGPIGLLFVHLARLRGVRIIATDREAARLESARRAGAAETVNVAEMEDVVGAVRGLTPGGRGADVGVEAVGMPEVWEASLRMARKGGRVNLFGGCKPGTEMRLPTELMHYSELTLIAVFHHTPDIVRRSLAVLARGEIDTDLLVTQQFPLERLPEALEMIVEHRGVKSEVIPG